MTIIAFALIAISIHAPSRERQTRYSFSQFDLGISIHAPPRERHLYNLDKMADADISIHAPSRERHGLLFCTNIRQSISIHAPSRERQHTDDSCPNPYSDFNPRSLAGATASCESEQDALTNFNPRSLAGATISYNYLKAHGVPISIHAPSRERHPSPSLSWLKREISIHAPSRERHCICSQFCRHYGDFNPRFLAGATASMPCRLTVAAYFNPRSLAGATR